MTKVIIFKNQKRWAKRVEHFFRYNDQRKENSVAKELPPLRVILAREANLEQQVTEVLFTNNGISPDIMVKTPHEPYAPVNDANARAKLFTNDRGQLGCVLYNADWFSYSDLERAWKMMVISTKP